MLAHVCSFSHYIEVTTQSEQANEINPVDFKWELMPQDNGNMQIKVSWLAGGNNPTGTHFFIKYRVKGTRKWIHTSVAVREDFILIEGLSHDEVYELVAVSVNVADESAIREIKSGDIRKNE